MSISPVALFMAIAFALTSWDAVSAQDAGAELRRLEKQFKDHYASGRYRQAEPIARRMVTITEKSFQNRPVFVACSLDHMGTLYRRQGKYAEAEVCFQRALAIIEKAVGPEHRNVAVSLHNLANLYGDQGKYAEAEPLYRRSMTIQEKVFGREHPSVAMSLNNLAVLYQRQGKYDDAELLSRRSLAIQEKVLGREHPSVAAGLNNLALLYGNQGKYAEAEPLSRRSLVIQEKALGREHPSVAMSLNNLALLYVNQGKYVEAEPLYQRSLKIDEKVLGPEHPSVAMSLNNLGSLYRLQGKYAEAEPLFQRSLRMKQKVLGPEHPEVADGLNNLAILYSEQGKYDEAELLYQRSLRITEKVLGPEHPSVAGSLNNLANVYYVQGKYVEAEPLFQRSLGMKEKVLGLEHPSVALSLNNLGNLYRRQDKYFIAETLHRRSLKIYEKVLGAENPEVAGGLNNLAILYNDQGKYAEAQPLISRTILIQDHRGVGPRDRSNSYLVRAMSHWGQDHKSEAISDLREAMRLAELQRGQTSGAEQDRAIAFAMFDSVFETMVNWQYELGDVAEALSAAERFRTRALQDQMAVSGVDLLEGLPAVQSQSLRKREADALSRVASLEKQLSILPRRKDVAEAQKKTRHQSLDQQLKLARDEAIEAYRAIRNASQAYRLAASTDRKPVTLAKLQSWMDESEGLLLEYFLGSTSGYLFIVPAEGEAKLVPLTISKEQAVALGIEAGPLTADRIKSALMNEDHTGVLNLLHDPQRANSAAAQLSVLWELLVPEAQRELITSNTLKHLIVIPDGPLSLLPFETLVVDNHRVPIYLLDVGPPTMHGPSATILYNLSQLEQGKSRQSQPVLTVGDPVYSSSHTNNSYTGNALAELESGSRYVNAGGTLARLPHSGVESHWVSSVFERDGGIASKQLLRSAATEANVRDEIEGRRWIHLACHGQADQEYGNFFGALALTPNSRSHDSLGDGFLTLPEIYGLNLTGCELSILSACQTNFGPQQKSEGVWALSRGFLVAGSKRVIASNWLVNDQAAATLISYFCSGVAQSEKKGKSSDYARSLHEAKQFVRQQDEWSSPYYWGTFVLVGPH